eukprot:gnl/TRDRNA2_/TRDRNA2_53981_c0_seq1.p1 gnl/TRDRNA2_/TRDRNA2_53981_c0~~gnl/TRDRNA2_/TRDRNA2_53981_c0_seq1.p1  ORF type:complete len:330 (+),score=52.28 gnl/TRDRNA2_/TRDRNA2_53981_c0_seq1:59-1048(+)
MSFHGLALGVAMLVKTSIGLALMQRPGTKLISLQEEASLVTDAGKVEKWPKPAVAFDWQKVAKMPKTWEVKILRELPHQELPFTQALEFMNNGNLVESSGAYPEGKASYIRMVDPATGKTIRKTTAGLQNTFVEGIAHRPSTGHWYASTYESNKIIEYDSGFNYLTTHSYPEVGWGLAMSPDGSRFLATQGNASLFVINPDTMTVESVKTASCGGKAVPQLNELEMVHNFDGKPALFANVYQTRLVLALDPTTFECTHVFHLNGVPEAVSAGEQNGFHVANGIAYNKNTGKFFVTGKNWKKMFEVQLTAAENQAHRTTLDLLSDLLVRL